MTCFVHHNVHVVYVFSSSNHFLLILFALHFEHKFDHNIFKRTLELLHHISTQNLFQNIRQSTTL